MTVYMVMNRYSRLVIVPVSFQRSMFFIDENSVEFFSTDFSEVKDYIRIQDMKAEFSAQNKIPAEGEKISAKEGEKNE